MRWHAHHKTQGTGHLYQGRFKAFPIEQEDYLLRVLRYVERNALRANLCQRAEEWKWCSLWRRQNAKHIETDFLAGWPINRPRQWVSHVNKSQSDQELTAIRHSVKRGTSLGSANWVTQSAARLQLTHTHFAPGAGLVASKSSCVGLRCCDFMEASFCELQHVS